MTRVNLFALAAALLFSCPAAVLAQTTAPKDADWSHAVNLMAMIDPAKDAIKGEWKMEGGELISDQSRQAKLQIPYEPHGEYDFRITFTCSEGMSSVAHYVSHRGRCAFWFMGGASTFVFPGVDSTRMKRDTKTAQVDRRLELRRKCTSVLQVRNRGVSAYVNGEFITRWATDYNDANLFPVWEIPNHKCLAVGCDGTTTTFHKIEVLEINGKGKVVPHYRQRREGKQ